MKNNKGITLVALVITIIVLAILAAVSINALTGQNGIVKEALKTSEDSVIAEEKENVTTSYMGAAMKNHGFGTTVDALQAELDATVGVGKTEVIENEGELIVKYLETGRSYIAGDLFVNENEAIVGKEVTESNKTYTKNGTAVIPVGFTIVPGLDDVSKGLVISDNPNDTEKDPNNIVAEGNQFVWVPVSKENFSTEFVRHDFGTQNIPDDYFVSRIPEYETGIYGEYVGNGIDVDRNASSAEQETQKMYKSVKNNGGFYIGRYETGVESITNGSNSGIRGTAVSKKGANVYNYILWGGYENELGGAVEVARGFSEVHNYETVISTLVYGVQWDAVMRWISKDDALKGYLTDSMSIGNFVDNDSTNNPAKTGAVEEYKLKNIYDMAGNVYEWTMESYEAKPYATYRGGCFKFENGTINTRDGYYKQISTDVDWIGFRVALFVEI